MRLNTLILFNLITLGFFTSPFLFYFPNSYKFTLSEEKHITTIEKYIPSDSSLPSMPDGRHYPLVPNKPKEIAELLSKLETALRISSTSKEHLALLGHQQQVIYRVLAEDKTLSENVLSRLPVKWKGVAKLHLHARRQFLTMGSPSVASYVMPRWRIIEPEPALNLLSYYQKAERNTGIDWEVLAAINLIESGMGRIDGVSIANAQGPMQFLPSTWAEKGIGDNGDIRDPHDSIQAAARYLVRRGGLTDIRQGLWGYNNSSYYGEAVLTYSQLLKEDPMAYIGLYNWEIHYKVGSYDLWLPVGYNQEISIPISTYLKLFPASAPPPTTLPSKPLTQSRG